MKLDAWIQFSWIKSVACAAVLVCFSQPALPEQPNFLPPTMDLDAETYFETHPLYFTRGGPHGAFTGKSCEELSEFFERLARQAEYPCTGHHTDHKFGLLRAISRCIDDAGGDTADAMKQLFRRELACPEPSPEVFSLLEGTVTSDISGGAGSPAAELLPDYLAAYWEGRLEYEWPWETPPSLSAGPHHFARGGPGSEVMRYISRWRIVDTDLAVQGYELYHSDGNPRGLMSALQLADGDLFADMVSGVLEDLEPDFSLVDSQVMVAAFRERLERGDYRLFLYSLTPEVRQAAALWLVELARRAEVTSDEELQELIDNHDDPTEHGSVRADSLSRRELLRTALSPLGLLANEREFSLEEIEELEETARQHPGIVVLPYRSIPVEFSADVRSAIEEASTSANTEMVRDRLASVMEHLDDQSGRP